jgi:hypothetical protein
MFLEIACAPGDPPEPVARLQGWVQHSAGMVRLLVLNVEFPRRLISAACGIRISLFMVKPVLFRYPSDSLTPLSWHLTPHQQKNIGEAWSRPSTDLIAQREILLRGLECATPSSAQ